MEPIGMPNRDQKYIRQVTSAIPTPTAVENDGQYLGRLEEGSEDGLLPGSGRLNDDAEAGPASSRALTIELSDLSARDMEVVVNDEDEVVDSCFRRIGRLGFQYIRL